MSGTINRLNIGSPLPVWQALGKVGFWYESGTVLELLKDQVSQTPNAAALRCGVKSMTYRELWEASDA
ncbi:MAG: hypothetical protein AAGI34_16480, partial [Pseudomonadota bacterium]